MINRLQVYFPSEKSNWLKYILSEFQRINRANFEIIVLKDKSSLVEGTATLKYLPETEKEADIPNHSEKKIDSEISFLENGFFVLKNSISKNSSAGFSYDIFWNAFVFLSRLEEYELSKIGRSTNSYSLRHPRKNKESFHIPVVNLLFNELEGFIMERFPSLEFDQKQRPILAFGHDLDYIKKTIQLRIKQGGFQVYNSLRSLHRPTEFLRRAKDGFNFLLSDPDYWQFDYWKELEKANNIRSCFFVYSKTNENKGLRSWLLDPSYNLENESLKKELKVLKKEGFEIGLHGSFNSAFFEGLLKKEKETLENELGFEIGSTRQHWLNYEESSTPFFHEELGFNDYTIGWNDIPGYRAGIASRFHPYDHINERAFEHWQVPQLIMDSHIYDYGKGNEESILTLAIEKIKELNQFKSSEVSISWHPRTSSSDYNWQVSYERILKEAVA